MLNYGPQRTLRTPEVQVHDQRRVHSSRRYRSAGVVWVRLSVVTFFNVDEWHQLVNDRVADLDRVAAVNSTALIDTATEASFDRRTRLVAEVIGVPWTFITIVDADRCFWKSAHGVDPAVRESAAQDSFCKYVIAMDGPFTVSDARLDERTRDNPSIAAMSIVAWAGYPVRAEEGHILGALCAVDTQPRQWSPIDLMLLETLADSLSVEIQLRTAHADAATLRTEIALRDLMVGRAAMLADLAQLLSAADSVAAVGEIITTTGRSALAADLINLALVDDEHRNLRTVYSPPLSPVQAAKWATVSLQGDFPLAHAVLHNRPIYVSDGAMRASAYPHLVDDAITAGIEATAALPLLRSDRTVAGAIGVGWVEPVEFSPIMRSLLITVAQMCGQALDRCLLGDARRGFLRSLQGALLPRIPSAEGLEIAAEYLPANSELGFGGDWYDVIALSPHRTALIIGDVCGHGLEAAATMTQIRGAINSLVRTNWDRLEHLFDTVEVVLDREHDFVATVAVYVIDTTRNMISYVSAGHPPAIVIPVEGDFTLLEGGRRPVLGIGGPLPVVGTHPFEPGDLLVSYTDGLVEHGRRDLASGIRTTANALVALRSEALPTIVRELSREVAHATDDIAFAIVRRERDAHIANG